VNVLKQNGNFQKRKNFLDEIDDVSCMKYLVLRARTFVVEHSWEISILSCVRTGLMCHLAKLF
jgi:hypothetical protein